METNNSRISNNVAAIQVSAIKEMAMRSARFRDTASLAWGVPSFRTPEHIRKAITRSLETDTDIGKYALPDGIPELREVVAGTHFDATGISVDPDLNVMITCGNMQGLNSLFHTIINPGDEIIVTDPGFASHIQQIRLCGGKPVFCSLDESMNWQLDANTLSDLISDRTKAIVIVSPSNPTGKIFSEEQLLSVGKVALDNDILILLDDPYCHFTYENQDRYFNLSSVPELKNHIVYLFTFSKAYAMSGWRLGYMIAPEQLKQEVLKVHDATIICTPRISQVAGLYALKEEPVHLQRFEQILADRRSLICQRLDAVPHIFQYNQPEGAYYVFPKIVLKHINSYQFSIELLELAKVAVTPGSAFGPGGEHHVRMAFCVSDEIINKAFDQIEDKFPM